MNTPYLHQRIRRAPGRIARATRIALGVGLTTVAFSRPVSGPTLRAGTPVKLVFIMPPPVEVRGGAKIRPVMRVAVQDSAGATVTTAGDTITLVVQSGPVGGTIAGRTSVAALQGVASFDSVSINLVGEYTLVATTQASGVESETSNVVTVKVGPAARLGFDVQPTNTLKASQFSGLPLTVAVMDSGGNIVDGATNYPVRIALGANPGSAKLTGADSTRTGADGRARFPAASISLLGEGYTLVASTSVAGIDKATSAPFAIRDPGVAARLKIIPGSGLYRQIADSTPATPSIVVVVQDTGGVPVVAAAKTAGVSLLLLNGAPKLLHQGTTPPPDPKGQLRFKPTIMQAGHYRLVASSTIPGVAPDTSPWFDVGVGNPRGVKVVVGPQSSALNTPVSPAIQVRVVDPADMTVSTASNVVEASLRPRAGQPPGALAGRLKAEAVNGVATFDSLIVTAGGENYRIIFRSPGLKYDTSAAFNVATPGPAAKLSILATPTDVKGGSPIAPPIRVVATDAAGIVVTSWDQPIAIGILHGPQGAVVTGKPAEDAVNGAATFAKLIVNTAGTGYKLVATADGLQSDSTSVFQVDPGPPDHLNFVKQPASYTFGFEMPSSPTVAVVDKGDNVVESATDSIVLGVRPNFPLRGKITARATAGIATFSQLRVDGLRPGQDARLVARSAALSRLAPGVSEKFTATPGQAARLHVIAVPKGATSGARFPTAVAVEVLDANNNRVSGDNSDVVIGIAPGANPGKALLEGGLRIKAKDGVATFTDLTISRLGMGYKLVASGASLASDTSESFTVIGPAYKLVFVRQPENGLRNGTLSAMVQVQDSLGSPRNVGNVDVTVSLEPSVAAPKAKLLGTTKATAKSTSAAAPTGTAVEAKFDDMRVTEEGTGFRLVASAPKLAIATSEPFALSGYGPAYKLAFVGDVPVSNPGVPMGQSVDVQVQDSVGNVVQNSSETVQLALDANQAGATLAGTNGHEAALGVASFTGMSVSAIGKRFTLRATAGPLKAATSRPFAVVDPAAPCKVAFAPQQPKQAVAGQPIMPAFTVQVQRCDGAMVATATDTVTVTAIPDPTGPPTTPTGNVAKVPAGGVATFDSLTIPHADAYRLQATAPGLTPAKSNVFSIVAGKATRLVVENAPTTFIAGFPMGGKLRVRVADQYGNQVKDAVNSVTIGLECVYSTSTTQGLVVKGMAGIFAPDQPLSCIQPKAASGNQAKQGLVEFDLLNYTPRGAAPETRFVFTSPGLAEDRTSPFTIAPGAPVKLGFEGVVSSEPRYARFDFTGISVAIRDSIGNNVPSGSDVVELSIDSGTTGKLNGKTQERAINGIATYGPLALSAGGMRIRLRATAPNIEPGISPEFPVELFKDAKRLQFKAEPVNMASGQTMPPVQVEVQDEAGNVVLTANLRVKLSLIDPSGTRIPMKGEGPERAVNGIATFKDIRINTAGTGYTIQASVEEFPGEATSHTFDVVTPATAKPAADDRGGGGGARQERHLQ